MSSHTNNRAFGRGAWPRQMAAVAVMTLLLSACGLLPAAAPPPAATPEPSPRTLTVIGASLINADPDVAVITFGWWSKDADPDVAFVNSKTKHAKLLVGLSALDIAPDDLMAGTVSVGSEPVYGPDGFPTDQNLYAVNELFVLTLQNPAKLAGALNAIREAAGAPYLFTQQVTYDLAPEAREALLQKTQAAAVADARANAERLAQALNLTLGEPQTVTVTQQQVTSQAALQAQVTLQVTYAVTTP
jgi:uncharacterized protein YggE